jgi:hypothetical protein
VSILWSADEAGSCLVINGYPRAVFDFNTRDGYSQNDYPNWPATQNARWTIKTHVWDAPLHGFNVKGDS